MTWVTRTALQGQWHWQQLLLHSATVTAIASWQLQKQREGKSTNHLHAAWWHCFVALP